MKKMSVSTTTIMTAHTVMTMTKTAPMATAMPTMTTTKHRMAIITITMAAWIPTPGRTH